MSEPGRKRRFTVDALFTDTRPQAVGVSELPGASEIALDRIVADPDQPRRTFDQERLDELAASIRTEGILQPIVVRYDAGADRYIIVHGERRWRAATLAGLPAIPALVRDIPAERRLIQQLMENIVRDDLNPVDRSVALRRLKEQLGDVSWEEVAAAVGIKRSRLFQLLSTERLPEPVQDDIRAGRLSEKQSRALQNLAPRFQLALRDEIVERALPLAQAGALARQLRTLDPPPDEHAARTTIASLRASLNTVPADAAATPAATDEAISTESLLALLERVAGGDRAAAAPLAEHLAALHADPYNHRRLDKEARTLALRLATLHAAPRRERDQARPLLESLRNTLNALLDNDR